MNDNLNFREDIAIDNMSLEEELTRQPLLLFDYSEEYNDLKDQLKALELELSVEIANAAFRLRAENKDKKVTENVIKELLEKDEILTRKKKEINEKKREVDRIGSAVESIAQRRYVLQKLVDLWIYNYYNNVKTTGSGPGRGIFQGDDVEQLRGLTKED
jgi:hypothetical protein